MRHTPVRSRKDRAKDVDAQPTDCSKSHALPALSCITEENAHRPESGTCAPHVCTVRSADAWQTAHWRQFCKTRKPDLSPASRPQRNRKPKARPLVVSYSAAAAVQDLLYHSCNRFARLLLAAPRNFYNFHCDFCGTFTEISKNRMSCSVTICCKLSYFGMLPGKKIPAGKRIRPAGMVSLFFRMLHSLHKICLRNVWSSSVLPW